MAERRFKPVMSTELVDAWVPGDPKAQPRPRAFARGNRIRMYDPGTAAAWKARVVESLRPWKPEQQIDAPVLMVVEFYLPRPQRLLRVKDADDPISCGSKPDLDNLVKAVMDAMTDDGWWCDDSIVVALCASKMFHSKGGSPGARILLRQLSEDSSVTFS